MLVQIVYFIPTRAAFRNRQEGSFVVATKTTGNCTKRISRAKTLINL